MSAKPWFPFYAGDFLRDTLDLDTEQIGAYVLLLMHYYQTGGLPNQANTLAKIARVSRRKWRAIAKALAPKFRPGWINARADEEIEKQRQLSKKRAAAGSRGGRRAQAKRVKQLLEQLPPQPQPYSKILTEGSESGPAQRLEASTELAALLRKTYNGSGDPQ